MKQGIHPDYHPVVFRDRSADFTFLTRSTAVSDRTIEWEDGNTYPVVDVEVSSASHPFYTGAVARARHRRAGGAVPPPVRQRRQGRQQRLSRQRLGHRRRPAAGKTVEVAGKLRVRSG